MKHLENRRARSLILLALGVAVVFGLSPAMGQERGRCATTELPGHLILPDGKIHEAGKIKICFEGWLWPGTGRHAIHVNGQFWGYLMSRSGRTESEEQLAETPLLVFTTRSDFDHVRLIGYAWPTRDGMQTHVLHQPGKKPSKAFADASRLLEHVEEEQLYLATGRFE
jgi:hypothetical protein